jgi:hypothetical protein
MALELRVSRTIRSHMLDELDADLAADCLYLSPRLSPPGRARYPSLLRAAMEDGDDRTLEAALSEPGVLSEVERSHSRTGAAIVKRVPFDAATTLAEGEWNRFYLRALCIESVRRGFNEVVVYRAKLCRNPRSSSEAMIGTALDARSLLDDLREHPGVDTALGLPPGPNSGLSARLPETPAQAA